jgi:hypothetical protein
MNLETKVQSMASKLAGSMQVVKEVFGRQAGGVLGPITE